MRSRRHVPLRIVLAVPIVAALVTGAARQPRNSLPVIELINEGPARGEIALTTDLPRGLPGDAIQLRADDGTVVPVQVSLDRRISFVLPAVAAGERRRLTLEPALDRRPRPLVEAVRHTAGVELRVESQPVASYHGETLPGTSATAASRRRRGGYLHPVISPLGRVVTDDAPADARQHHGIWSGWAAATANGRRLDFWNERTGAVEFESLIDAWSGPVHGGFRARHRYVDLTTGLPVTVLTEVWEVTAYAVGRGTPAYRLIDLVSRQDTTSGPLVLQGSLDGGLGVRGHHTWTGTSRAQVLTSEGRTRRDGNGTRARWWFMGGHSEGRAAGLAVLDHPQNVRHPQPVRIHPTVPFVGSAPAALGELTLAADRPYVSRYRLVVIDGAADAALFDRLWQDFAHPPAVTLRP